MRVLALFAILPCLLACRTPTKDEPKEAPASPQANAVPAPLTTLPTKIGAAPAIGDAGPPPELARPQTSLPADTSLRDGPGYTLTVALRFPEAPGILRGDLPQATLEAARRRVEPSLAVELGPQRAKLTLKGRAHLLSEGTELRLRSDFYGGALVTDGGSVYRVLVPGTLRALFNDRRLDVGPLTPAEIALGGEGARRLGYRTRKVEVWTRAAKASFELAKVQDAGEGGVLLCRFLLDWMSAAPATPLCQDGEVPLHAELHWTPRGVLVFDAVSIARRLDMPAASLAAPPPASRFSTEPLPREGGALFLSPQEILALRPGGETARLVLQNGGDEVRITWLDGVPFGWVAPGGRVEIAQLPKGKIGVEWRTFLDDADKVPLQSLTLPAASDASGADAGL